MKRFKKKKLTFSKGETWWGIGGRGGMEINQEFKINIRTLLYIKDITKNLLHSTGNLIQCPIITYMGKESDKE